MIVVLGDLIADLSLHIPDFPIQAEDLIQLEFLDLGPGGACNVAIMAARFGAEVVCLGELGQDRFGDIVLEGLQAEGIDTSSIARVESSSTPLAGVVVDQAGEPAYLGYRGSLQLGKLAPAWRETIRSADGLFADGWIEHAAASEMILEAFSIAQSAGVPTFFDPGPGNPQQDLGWQRQALSQTDVLLLNEQEAARLSGAHDPGQALLDLGPQLVLIKRGAAGCLVVAEHHQATQPGYPVEVLDATGAGDSFDAAAIYGYLSGLDGEQLAKLANATGAAKVRKRGTGRNLPTIEEIQRILLEASDQVAGWSPSSAGDG